MRLRSIVPYSPQFGNEGKKERLHPFQSAWQGSREGVDVMKQASEWQRVDRSINEARKKLEEASTEEQFQAIGVFCREVLISLAQAVYDPAVHSSLDDVTPSKTDAKRMLEAYIPEFDTWASDWN